MANYQASGSTSGSGSSSGGQGYRPIEILLLQLKQCAVRFSQSMERLKAIKDGEIAQVQRVEDDKENFMKLLGELVRNLGESQQRETVIAQVRRTEEIFATTDALWPFLKQVVEFKGQMRDRMARIDQEIIWMRNLLSRLEEIADTRHGSAATKTQGQATYEQTVEPGEELRRSNRPKRTPARLLD